MSIDQPFPTHVPPPYVPSGVIEVHELEPQGLALVPGYGCYWNPAHLLKIDVTNAGSGYEVVAYLSDPSPAGARQGSIVRLTGPIEHESDAFRECDRIARELSDGRLARTATWPTPAT